MFKQWRVDSCVLLTLGTLATACGNATGPRIVSSGVLVIGNWAESLAVVARSGDSLLGRVGPIPSYKSAVGLSPDGTGLYITASDASTPPSLFEVNLSTGEVSRTVAMSAMAMRSVAGPISPSGTYLLAPTPDLRGLLIDGDSAGVPGLVYVDLATLTPRHFRDSVFVAAGASAVLPGTKRLAILIRRVTDVPADDWVMVLDSTGLQAIDSVPVTSPTIRSYPEATELVPGADSAHIYVVRPDTIALFDLTSKSVVDNVKTGVANGWLCRDPVTGDLYLTDPGDGFNTPGTGMIVVFGSALTPVTTIDLTSESVGGVPPVLVACAVDGQLGNLYVSSGTAYRGPLFGTQPGRLITLRVQDGAVVHTVSLDDWGVGMVIAP